MGSVAAQEGEAGEQRGIGQGVDEDAQRHLVEPVAEQADRLGQPEAGESGVQREPDVRVLADSRAERPRRREWCRNARAKSAAEDDRPLEADVPVSLQLTLPPGTQADAAFRILFPAQRAC